MSQIKNSKIDFKLTITYVYNNNTYKFKKNRTDLSTITTFL